MLRVESKKQTFPLFAILINNNFNGHVQKPGTPEHQNTSEQRFILITWSVIGKQNNTVKFNSLFRVVPVFQGVPGFSSCHFNARFPYYYQKIVK